MKEGKREGEEGRGEAREEGRGERVDSISSTKLHWDSLVFSYQYKSSSS